MGSIVGSATAVNDPPSGTINSVQVTIPATVEPGDRLYAFVAVGRYPDGAAITTPSGWSKTTEQGSGILTYLGAIFERDAEEGDEGSLLTVAVNGCLYAHITVVACRDFTLEGASWLFGNPPEVPVDLSAGDVFLAFAWGAGITSAFEDNDGVFPTLSTSAMTAAFYMSAGAVAGISPGPLTSVPLRMWDNSTGANNLNFYVYTITGVPGGDPPPPPTPLPGSPFQSSGDRLRSSFSESVGSLLESVEARPVDARAGEDFTNAQALEPAVRTQFREVTRARNAPPDFSYYPRPRQNTMEENQYEGITILSRLATWYPPTMFDTAVNLGIVGAGAATAQQVVQHVLDQWAGLLPWLTVAPVPDLRLRKEFYNPGSYGPSDGLVTTETVTIDQSGENRRDALTVLHDLLSPFPGTIVRQDSAGVLRIVPIYGPDADSTPALTLDEDWDLYSVSRGRPDPFSVKNRATVTNTSFERGEEVALMQPAWFQIGSNYQLGLDTWFEPPNDRLNLQEPYGEDDVLQESLHFGQFSSQLPASWPMGSSSIAAGDGISLRDGSNNPTITCAWRRYAGSSLQDSGTGTLTLLEDEIPFDGVFRDTFKWDEGSQTLIIRCRWDAVSKSVQFGLGAGNLESGCITGCKGWVVEFTLNDSSVGYAAGASKSATFGVVDDGDALPAESDTGNAILDSQNAFGVLESTIDIRGYDLDLTTLQQVARAYVLQNITPRATRDIELSSVGSRLSFDHMGRLVELPNGEQGYVVAVEYSDEFTTGAWSKTAQVQIANTDADGAVPVTDVYYLDSNGEPYMTTGLLGLPGGAYEVDDA